MGYPALKGVCYIPALAPENQGRIKKLAECYGKENLVVVLGMSDAGALEVAAETLSQGILALSGLWLEFR